MTVIAPLLLGAGFAVIMALTALYQGWAVSLVWNWFIAPLGITKISVLHGYGITLVAALLKGYKPAEARSEEQWIDDAFSALLAPLIVVGCAFVAKMFL